MDITLLDDFIKYAKEKYGCDITIEKSETPDTFETIFGTEINEESQCAN